MRRIRRWTIGMEQARTRYNVVNFFLGLLILGLLPYGLLLLGWWR